MDKRRSNRTRFRSTCELIIDGQRHPAVVRDLAPTGLFVQTRARPAANSVVGLRFPATAGAPGFEIEVGVARHRSVHPRLQSEIQSGIGLEILGRPADYLAYAGQILGPSLAPPSRPAEANRAAPPALRPVPTEATFEEDEPIGIGSADGPPLRTYRVRLTSIGQHAPRTLTVQATSLASARAQAMSQVGGAWKITDVQTI